MNLKTKKEIRKETLRIRDSIAPEERAQLSVRIMENLFSMPQWPPSRGAMFFMTMRSEVDTEPMIRAAMEQGVRVALPRMAGPGRIEPCWVSNIDAELAPNSIGIREPAEFCAGAGLDDIGIVVVPGAAFDPSGSRVGYGGGFYDRFLREIPRALRVAVAFDAQVVESIDTSANDVPVDILVTESGTKVFYRRLTPADWLGTVQCDDQSGPERVSSPAPEPSASENDAPDASVPADDGGAGPVDESEGEDSGPNGDADDAGEQGADPEAESGEGKDEASSSQKPRSGSPSGKTMKRKKKRGKRR